MSTATLYEMVVSRIDAMSVAYPFLETEHLPALRVGLRENEVMHAHEIEKLRTTIGELHERVHDLGGADEKPAVLRKGRGK